MPSLQPAKNWNSPPPVTKDVLQSFFELSSSYTTNLSYNKFVVYRRSADQNPHSSRSLTGIKSRQLLSPFLIDINCKDKVISQCRVVGHEMISLFIFNKRLR